MDATAPGESGDRIAKVIARAGLCSRREAERWVAQGRVAVDNRVLDSPAFDVPPGALVTVDGKPLPEAEAPRLWRYHKPSGLVTSHKDEKGRDTIFDHLPPGLPRVISVGRLDLTSEGLLLLTNDGGLARRLELPSTGWVRRYKVRVHGHIEPERLLALEAGVTIDGVRYGPIRAELEREKGANAWISIGLTEGKNREIRRVMEYLGLTVNRLIRLSYGPFQLGSLERAHVEEIPRKVLREQLGEATRPTGDRARESLFNLLAHRRFDGIPFPLLPGARVLDAFAGTGALGLEALSRGAAHVTFMEQARPALATIRQNLIALGETAHGLLLPGDACRPGPAESPVDLALMDAPYQAGLTEPALQALTQAGWIGSATLCVAEVAAAEELLAPGFARLDDRRYGAARLLFLRREVS